MQHTTTNATPSLQMLLTLA